MPTRKTNPRTEVQQKQRREFTEFARNWTRELISICSKRMAQGNVSNRAIIHANKTNQSTTYRDTPQSTT
jgi:hypothetical protein